MDPNPPVGSGQGWARFEERVRQRRTEHRLAAARAAISRRQLREAAAAVEEVRQLDPEHPELIAIGQELDAAAHQPGTRWRKGPWAISGAAAAVVLLAASGRESDVSFLNAHSLVVPSQLVSSVTPASSASVGTTGFVEGVSAAPGGVAPATNVPAESLPQAPQSAPSVQPVAPPATPEAPEPVVAPAVASIAPVVAVNTVESQPVGLARVPEDDNMLVRRALQRYRQAYEDLDAGSAPAVRPAVDRPALERAFDGLRLQRLTFDECEVRLGGTSAQAVCRGFTEYVPKVGSREIQVEPRVWTFTLSKNDGDWNIESARADR